MNQEKINTEIKNELFSAKEEVVIAALEKISAHGNKLYIPVLFDLLLTKPGNEVTNEVLKLLSTVKAKETVTLFADALQNEKYKSIRKNILTTCWQNGLDYHDYLPVFVTIVIEDDWETAFEAFTVIDNLEFLPEENIIEQSKHIIAGAIKNIPENKEYFLNEILAKIS